VAPLRFSNMPILAWLTLVEGAIHDINLRWRLPQDHREGSDFIRLSAIRRHIFVQHKKKLGCKLESAIVCYTSP
jgi:hypothetical protein